MSRLETIIDNRKSRRERANEAAERATERRQKRDAADRRKMIREKVLIHFARLRKLVRCRFDKYSPSHMVFEYKAHKCSVTFENWFIPKHPGDVDDYDMSGEQWAFHIWNGLGGGYAGPGYCIVDATDVVEGKDYTSKVVELLEEHIKVK